MSNPKDKPATPPPADIGPRRSSGRPGLDDKGNPIWEWQLETGVYSRDVDSQRIKKLDLDGLSLADTAVHERPDFAKDKNDKNKKSTSIPMPKSTGFNPYDNATKVSGSGFNPYDNARSLGDKLNAPKEEAPRHTRTPDELRKLDAHLKAQRKLQEKNK
jgi:hypothetical protein